MRRVVTDKSVLDNQVPPEEHEQLIQLRAELDELELTALIDHVLERFDDLPPRERERFSALWRKLEGQELIPLLKQFMERFDLTANQVAVSAEMDESAFRKLLGGDRRQFKPEHVDALLEDLWTLGKLTDPIELLAWHQALRVASVVHVDFYKDILPRLARILDPQERERVLEEYLENLYPAWVKLYRKTKGVLPALIPLPSLPERRTKLFIEPGMILIPAGEFVMGSDPRTDKYARDNEQPQHKLYLPGFYMAKTPVTNEQYAAFVNATGHRPPDHWRDGMIPRGREDHPVVQVSWNDAVAYCKWLAEVTGTQHRLPSEAEWEKGARGTEGWIYPWGNEWDPERCNSREKGPRNTTPVEAYPQGASSYGLLDLAGNVWEWTLSLYRKYPYWVDDGREDPDGAARRVVRGGSWGRDERSVRCACRIGYYPGSRGSSLGFRIVVSPISPTSGL